MPKGQGELNSQGGCEGPLGLGGVVGVVLQAPQLGAVAQQVLVLQVLVQQTQGRQLAWESLQAQEGPLQAQQGLQAQYQAPQHNLRNSHHRAKGSCLEL